ncbi:MAG: TRAP transporter large permease [Candidatus Competibacteraceae bacterium]|nr:TRAP transporter large permease [Candidatus Competibacteraceae bacterium]
MSTALIGFGVLLLLVFLRLPIAFAMGLVGFVGFALQTNTRASLSMVGRLVIDTGQDYGLSVVPLFILMGLFVNRAGLSTELYRASYAFLGHFRGGLAMATIVACGGFSAICGSSLATAATMSRVAMPPMRKYGYSDGLAAASIAAGGTLGILIPPSVILVIYGLLTEQSIGKLFIAGIVPGLLGILFYVLAIRFAVARSPTAGPAGERSDWPERLAALRGVWTVLLLFLVVIGGIYGGVFTPTEAAGIGAGGAFLIALARRALSLYDLIEVLMDTARTTAMLFSVLIGALIFSNFVNRAGLPDALLALVTGFDVSPLVVMCLILLVYIVLGCVFESLSMLLLTVPIFFPLVQSLGFDLIWFGIIVVVVTEISLITPPVGLNVFVLRGVLGDISTGTIFRGVTPFWIVDILRLALLVLVPALSLWLPSLMMGG